MQEIANPQGGKYGQKIEDQQHHRHHQGCRGQRPDQHQGRRILLLLGLPQDPSPKSEESKRQQVHQHFQGRAGLRHKTQYGTEGKQYAPKDKK